MSDVLIWWDYNATGAVAVQQKVVELIEAGATEIDCQLRRATCAGDAKIIVLTCQRGLKDGANQNDNYSLGCARRGI